MLLAFDIGNSNAVLGLFRDGTLIFDWRIETDPNKSADEYGMLVRQLFETEGLGFSDVDDVIIATVVPSVLFTIRHMVTKYFKMEPIVVESGIRTGMVIKYDNPRSLGADRIVNAVAAFNKYGGDGPLIVIDMGTATTIDAVSEKGEFLGGTIAPGVKISSEVLFERTSKLPHVELEDPGHTICRNTIQGMQAGLVYGHMGMVDFIVRKMTASLREICGDKPVKVISTGGLSTLIDSGIDCIDIIDRRLTLDGLEIIYEKNRHNRHKRGKDSELRDIDGIPVRVSQQELDK